MNGYIDFDGSTALDLFAGTGSISLELLSRGCRELVSVELDRQHAAFISQCIAKVGADMESILVKGDALKYIKACRRQFDIIFADPPYALPELPTIPELILSSGLLAEDGLLVFEHGKKHDFSGHPRFVDHREYGSVNFSLFR